MITSQLIRYINIINLFPFFWCFQSRSVVTLSAIVTYSVGYPFGIYISLAIISFSNALKETSRAAITRCELQNVPLGTLAFLQRLKTTLT